MSEKNFEKVEIGEWYQQRNGQIFKMPADCVYENRKGGYLYWCTDGRHCSTKEHDLVLHIKPPVIEPMPTPENKIEVTSFCWRHGDTGNLYHTTKEDKEPINPLNRWRRFPAGDITGEVES